MRSLLTFGLLLALPPAAFGQPTSPAAAVSSMRNPEEGRPFVRIYQPPELGGAGQIWCIVQDQRGVLYFGTNGAVLEFDGAAWRRIALKESVQTARSLAVAPSGRIYLGAVGDLGYLAPSPTGAPQFVSLLDRVPEADRSFADVWRTFISGDSVYFQTERAVFIWAHDRIQVIRPISRFHRASFAEGRMYVPVPETGLNVVDGSTLRPLPGTETLGNEPYPIVLPYGGDRLLIGTRNNGLLLYDGARLAPFPTEIDAIAARGLYRGTSLPSGAFVLTTTSGGMVIIDRSGHRLAALDRTSGLPSNVVYYAMADREAGLWLGFDVGMARVETPSPVSFFGAADGLSSAIQGAIRYKGRLYVAVQTGAAYLAPASGADLRARFVPLSGGQNQCWNFEIVPDPAGHLDPALVVGCTTGLYEVRDATTIPIKAPADLTFNASAVTLSKTDPSRLWVGGLRGLSSFRRVGGRWVDEGAIEGAVGDIRTVVEEPDGALWIGTNGTGVLHVTFDSVPRSDSARPPAHARRFGTSEGLPPGGVIVVRIGGSIYFGGSVTDPRVMHFDPASGKFVRDTTLDVVGIDPVAIGTGLLPAPEGHAYLNYGKETVVATRKQDGSWSVDRKTFGRFGVSSPPIFLYGEPDGVIWMARIDGTVVRFDSEHAGNASPEMTTLIRGVSVRQRRLFDGYGALAEAPRLQASDNALRFEFAAPTFLDERVTEYQSRLDGLDTDWSNWSHESRRDYTNLGLGKYRFRVRARGVAGGVGQEAAYAFDILPPWYRTWWAYGGYLLLLGLFALAVDRTQRRRLIGKERQRAQMAEARLRAEAAETLARTEAEGKKNVELLSEIGREITASLDFDTIFGRLYERLNELADAEVFGVGLYHAGRHEIEYRLAIENGKRYTPYTRDTTDPNQLPVWCIEHREPVFINDLDAEVGRYITGYDEERRQLEDGTLSRRPQSIIYMPLLSKDKALGIVTIQSFEKHAYTAHDVNVMQSLATYTAIALDNASAYRQLNEQEHEIRRLFEEAERARAFAEEADAAKSSFLSTVSHELRTPLTSVLGFAKIIKRRLEERIFPLIQTDDRRVIQTLQQVGDNLNVVVSEGERLTRLIDDVLDLAKIEAGKLEWHMDQVSVGEVIDQATAATSSLFEQRGLQLVKEIAPDLPAVTGDSNRLVQVVINLISNAVKFTDTGSVTCRAALRGDEIVVSVIDTGMGIASADHPKVFERFKQVGDTLTDKPKGTGLGLPICREIVDHHGGRIWVESEIGHGSTFSFTLPVQSPEAGAPRPGGAVELAALIRQLREQVVVTTPRTTERQPRVLVVDDDANIRELLTQELTEAGYEVNVAGDGREALDVVRRDRPDLIVLDVMMPEMNGFDVAAVLKNDPQTMDIPIVILSIVQDRERGFRIGVDRYLTKPIDTEVLFREIGALIGQRKSHRRVLVVDDDASTVRTLTDVLTSRGYSVSEARDEDLLNRARELRPDIIMLNSVSSARTDAVKMLRFEKGMENVLFLVYQ
jgi:signal transduction histidine kinase/DNA-binding response OmpR family regulator